MIKSFRHKGLSELFLRGRGAKIAPDLRQRCLDRLDQLDAAGSLEALNVPGFRLHGLRGTPKRYSVWISGPWRITFEWIDGDALRVDLDQYH